MRLSMPRSGVDVVVIVLLFVPQCFITCNRSMRIRLFSSVPFASSPSPFRHSNVLDILFECQISFNICRHMSNVRFFPINNQCLVVSVIEDEGKRCDRCSMQFIRATDKTRHKNQHTRLNPRWDTKRCRSRFENNDKRRLHSEIDKGMRCLECGDSYTKSHFIARPLSCDTCLKTSSCRYCRRH